ncbi:hypothetical protein BJV82DRAFT_618976 [Fennellomyces sp. T-0311]|nr:hypothetical protein BJV82DRAFT_618976 [Fennellomyces sp. T-0311]
MIPLLLQWWRALVESVQFLQHNERTPYFDSLVEIVSRDEFLYYDRVSAVGSGNDVKIEMAYLSEYHELLNLTLSYAIDTASATAAHPGTIIFCSHILALCFFKVPGLASALLSALPVQQDTISQIRRELTGHVGDYSDDTYRTLLCRAMPAHLMSCSDDHQLRVPLKRNGHWISRWKTSDRALFIMFYQRYHIHLNAYIHAVQIPSAIAAMSIQARNAILALSPGYVHLAAYMTEKIGSLLRSSVMDEVPWCNNGSASSVSLTETSAKTFTAPPRAGSPVAPSSSQQQPQRSSSPIIQVARNDETPPRPSSPAIFDTSNNNSEQAYTGKPRNIESASRRYAYCLTSCAVDPYGDNKSAKSDIIIYQDMINVWIRAITRSISWTEPESVFCLIDFYDSVIGELQKKFTGNTLPLIDIPFILHTIHILLSQADNTIVHLRTFAFVFAHFGFLTQRPELVDLLCNRILLHPYIFERFVVHWSSGVRIFYLQCLFWRIRPLWSFYTVQWGTKGSKSGCNGKHCWSAWYDTDNEGMSFPSKSDLMLAHKKYTLEAHLTLETLLSSFYQQHARLNTMLEDMTNFRDRQAAIARLQANINTPLPFIPEFESELSPAQPRKRSSRPPPPPPPHNPYLLSPDQQSGRFSNNFKVATRRLSRTFLKASTDEDEHETMQRRHSTTAVYEKNEPVKPIYQQHYIVPASYSSRRRHSKGSLDESNNNSSYSSGSTSSSSSTCEDSAYASGRTTPTGLPIHHGKRSLSLSEIPETVSAANSWRYPPTAHTYAAKAVLEMDMIFNSASQTTTAPSSRRTSVASSSILKRSSLVMSHALPEISVDWPKAWASSQY